MGMLKGTGLCIEAECKKILRLAGIRDIYSKSKNTKTKLNLVKACFNALKKLSNMKLSEEHVKNYGVIEGKIK